MTLPVHDELVFDAHRDEVEELEVLVRENGERIVTQRAH